jgi:hypothetical protein
VQMHRNVCRPYIIKINEKEKFVEREFTGLRKIAEKNTDCKYIVKIYDKFEIKEHIILKMEYIHGRVSYFIFYFI